MGLGHMSWLVKQGWSHQNRQVQHKTVQPVYNSFKIRCNVRGLYDIITAPQQQVSIQH